MVRYGGPRFEFFFTHQFLNNEQTIRKEDAQRVAAIMRRRQKAQAAEAAREEAKQPQQPPEEVPCKSVVEPQGGSQREKGCKSLTALQRGGLAGRAGYVMFPTARGVPMPEGRGGAPYTPGLDRHRIVPQQLQREYRHEEERSRAAAANSSHAALSDEEAAERRNTQRRDEERRGTPTETVNVEEREDVARDRERPPSVFSHASSNAPIRALGTQHMDTISTKREVRDHLRRYGGVMVSPRREARVVTPFDDMTLPELTTRLVRMQQILRP